MTKRERLEDLGIIFCKLEALLEEEIFEDLESKHSYESWVKTNHDKLEYEEPRGLYHIHSTLRHINTKLSEILYLARGDFDD